MKVLLILLINVSTIFGKLEFKLRSVESNGLPFLEVTFPDKSRDTLNLRRSQDGFCTFLGHLNNYKSCVAVTGCPGLEPLEITLGGHPGGLFKLEINGTTLNSNQDLLANREDMDNTLEEDFGTFGTMGEDSAKKDPVEAMFKSKLPSTMLLRIKPHYDKSAFDWKNKNHENVKKYINYALTHAQVPFCHPSLGTAIKLELAEGEPIFHDFTWTPTTAIKNVKITDDNPETIDLHWYLSYTPGAEPGGMAGFGTVCRPEVRAKNKFSMFGFDDSHWTGQIMAHEIGHSLGMGHDAETELFLNDYETKLQLNHKDRGCNFKGQMSYLREKDGVTQWPPVQWSVCSRTDLHYYYDWIVYKYGKWCLKETEDIFDTCMSL